MRCATRRRRRRLLAYLRSFPSRVKRYTARGRGVIEFGLLVLAIPNRHHLHGHDRSKSVAIVENLEPALSKRLLISPPLAHNREIAGAWLRGQSRLRRLRSSGMPILDLVGQAVEPLNVLTRRRLAQKPQHDRSGYRL